MSLFYQDHLLQLMEFTCPELIEVDATRHVPCVPSYLMSTGCYLAVHQRNHLLPKCIVHLECHEGALWQREADGRARIGGT